VLDAPGPWGTGPFVLKEGYSSIYTDIALISDQLFASTWLTEKEDRTPYVVLKANTNYWNKDRGPRLDSVVFRNDLSPKQALDLCISTEGQVDIVTQVPPPDAEQVITSSYANLVAVNSNQVVAGIFNRFSEDIPINDWRLREALNLAVDRQKVITKGFQGYAKLVAALTPPWALDYPDGLQPKPHDPGRARQLLREVGWPQGRTLHLATLGKFKYAAKVVARDIEEYLNIDVKLIVILQEQLVVFKRLLAEKKLVPNWDILLMDSLALFLESTPAYIHREFFGYDGALRAGPELDKFDQLYAHMAVQTDQEKRLMVAKRIDRYVYDESLALFLCAPQSLYAVNKHVNFRPYRTTFELADTEVDKQHWSMKKS
jgi:peptide/nickel transport system substrate-binding protein